MGNDLSIIYKGETIANIGRKHLYTFWGNDPIPTEEEIKESLDMQRNYLVECMVAYSTYLLTKDENDVTEELDYLIDKVRARIDVFEELVMVAGRVHALRQIDDPFNEDVEILDDFEGEKRYPKKEEFTQDEMSADFHMGYYEEK